MNSKETRQVPHRVDLVDFSIITPSLNSVDVIADCIRSVEGQGHRVEHLVVDGESTDGTLEAISSNVGNVRVLSEPATGIYSALNSGIRASRGQIIGILHADDFFARSDVLDKVLEVFRDPDVDACYGDLCYVRRSEPGQVVRYWQAGEFQPGRFFNGWMPPHPTLFVRRKIYDEFGLFRTDLGTSADYELMVRLLVKHQVKAAYIPEVLVHMRTGGSSNFTWQARIRANRMDRRAWRVNGLSPYPWTLLAKPLRKAGQWWSRPKLPK